MDIGTVVGFVLGLAMILVAIMIGSPLSSFIDPASMIIVFGGTACVTLMAEKLPNVINGFKVAMNAFFNKSPHIEDTIKLIADLAVVVRKEGLLALENQTIENPFLAKGVRLAVDGIPPDEVQATMRAELIALKARHKRGAQMFRFAAASGPSMGMIGTLIGLVQMLQALDDPSAIGPAMAVALLTTLYGAILAFVICTPIAEKLGHRSAEEAANMAVIVEGLDSILKGENARIVQEKLEGFLAPKARTANAESK